MIPSSPARQIRWKHPIVTRLPACAADNLPIILRKAMPSDMSHSNATPTTVEDHDQSSSVDNSTEPSPVNAVPESNQRLVATLPALLTPDEDPGAPQPSYHPSGHSPTVSQDPAPTPSLSNQRLWFNPFSWSSRKGPPIAEVKLEMDSALEAAETVYICTESLENRSQPDSHEAMKSADPAGALGDSSPRTDPLSLPGDTASRFASIPHSNFNDLDVPCLPEEQSVSQPPPSPLPPHTQECTSPRTVATSAANAFVFNLPVFAKSRSPPEALSVPLPREPPAEHSCQPSVATPGMGVLVVI
ncbi:hypothetical protein EV363DRAFT_956997 [Boletus edulis]|nr:hypothetical protein EV363DRAFT_956997 [Boletus edulis]